VIWLLFRRELAPHDADHRTLAAVSTGATRQTTVRTVVAVIDWHLLVLFIGLFIVVGAAERQGIDRRLFALLEPLGFATVAGLTATAAVLSNAISNVPAVMLFTRVIPKLPDPPCGGRADKAGWAGRAGRAGRTGGARRSRPASPALPARLA